MSVIIKKYHEKKLEELIQEIFDQFNFKPFGRIFIKPNLSARPPIQKGENTSLEFIKALVKVLQKNAEEIIIGHSSLLGTADKVFPYRTVMESSGFSELEGFSKVKLINLDEVERIKFESKDFTFKIPKLLVDKSVNFYINVGALKTHMETVVSLAIKNQMGLLTGGERRGLHHGGELQKGIAYIGKFIKPDFSFIDGIWGMEGNGPHHGLSKKADLIMGSNDMVELDSMAATIMGLDSHSIEHISFSEYLSVGKLVSPEIVEKYQGEFIKFKPAAKFIKIGRNIFVWPTDACSMCITSLSQGGKLYTKNIFRGLKFAKLAFVGGKKINIVIGKARGLNFPKSERVVAIGVCPRDFAKRHGVDNLDKCPPAAKETFFYLKKKLK